MGAGLSPANSDLGILHRSLQRVCVRVCSCFFTVHLHTCTCMSDVQCVPLCDIVYTAVSGGICGTAVVPVVPPALSQ